jgi:hypothetical protein
MLAHLIRLAERGRVSSVTDGCLITSLIAGNADFLLVDLASPCLNRLDDTVFCSSGDDLIYGSY